MPDGVRCALFEEGARAFLGVARSHDNAAEALLDREGVLFGQALCVAQGREDGADGERAVAGNPVRNLAGFGQ